MLEFSRRSLLARSGIGMGALGLAGVLSDAGLLESAAIAASVAAQVLILDEEARAAAAHPRANKTMAGA